MSDFLAAAAATLSVIAALIALLALLLLVGAVPASFFVTTVEALGMGTPIFVGMHYWGLRISR